jgi:hypothetical protein
MIRHVAIALAFCLPAHAVAQTAVRPQVRPPLRRAVQAGLCVREPLPGFDAFSCVTSPVVRFYNNGTNVDGQTLSLPDPACGLPNPPPGCGTSGATCPGVPWK